MDMRKLPDSCRGGPNTRMCDLEIEGNVEGWMKKRLNIQRQQKPKEIIQYVIPDTPLGEGQKSEESRPYVGLWTEIPEESTGEETLRSYVYIQRIREVKKEQRRTWWKRIDKDIDFLSNFLFCGLVIFLLFVCGFCWWEGFSDVNYPVDSHEI